MALQIGIVGLPNVGKSTLFNALTKTQAAQAANYPFCTIDPNVGIVEVLDERLTKITEIAQPQKIIPAAIEFVDIAGLVKGASTGEGLGNQFLSHIRQVDAIAHVIRVFDDPDITHVHGEINPGSDKSVIEAELLIADTQTVEKRLAKALSESKSGQKDKVHYAEIIQALFDHLQEGKLAFSFTGDPEVKKLLKDLHLLTMKPILYVVNVKEDQINNVDIEQIRTQIGAEADTPIIPISAKIEEDLIGFTPEEAKEFLSEFNLTEPGLNSLIKEAYRTLGLQTYFTAGEKEVRAWTIKIGDSAPQAAGVIHTDFEKGFIKADVIAYSDFVEFGGESGAKEKGKLRQEGKDYIVRDGDVMHFKFNN